MTDYRELIARLRSATTLPAMNALCQDAADAIENLQAQMPRWNMIESRPMDEEERAYYSERYGFPLSEEDAITYCCPLPEHGQEVLVYNRYGHIWLDTFDDDADYGVGFETNGDMDGIIAWMPLPAPPEEVGE